MHSLFWRIFLTFWLALALILVGTVTVAVDAALKWRNERPSLAYQEIYTRAAQVFEAGGGDALKQWIQELSPPALRERTFVLDSSGHDLLERPLPSYPQTSREGQPSRLRLPTEPIGRSLMLVGPDGKAFRVVVVAGPNRGPIHRFGELELPGVRAATLIIALVVSAVVCFLLARYLTAPVDRLRDATQRIASGDLNVRVLPSLKGRKDDLGLLAADFDAMAERVRSLLESKHQLLRDVSHELRSPLARLQLALSLAQRGDNGQADNLARIGREADRLEQLIARALLLARLERPALGAESERVDITHLLAEIVADVAIEADVRRAQVALHTSGTLEVMADREALRSAFENVLRNAVRYSPVGSQLHVRAVRRDASIEVVIEDQGPGVPEKDLVLIFEPFYRVDSARDRAEGGEGLGLAIAARAITLHHGTIEARNLSPAGLAVRIVLPALA
ncbi:MAG TPA: ATP-binding protein [Steroidobacteraceae bacterium]